MSASDTPSVLRARVIEVTEEYWDSRESLSERVAVAQLILVLARTERERDEERKRAVDAETKVIRLSRGASKGRAFS